MRFYIILLNYVAGLGIGLSFGMSYKEDSMIEKFTDLVNNDFKICQTAAIEKGGSEIECEVERDIELFKLEMIKWYFIAIN